MVEHTISSTQPLQEHTTTYYSEECLTESSTRNPVAQYTYTNESLERDPSTSYIPIPNNRLSSPFLCATAHPSRILLSAAFMQGKYPGFAHRTTGPPLPPLSSAASCHQRVPSNQTPLHVSAVPRRSDETSVYSTEDLGLLVEPCGSRTPSPSIKKEADGSDCFVMENLDAAFYSSASEYPLNPPIEAPLRTTHACKDMRRMMGVFRLNPFMTHDADGREALSFSVGPLEEAGKLYEFQVAIEGEGERSGPMEPSKLSPEVENVGWERCYTSGGIMGIPLPSESLNPWDCQSLDAGFYPSPTESPLSLSPTIQSKVSTHKVFYIVQRPTPQLVLLFSVQLSVTTPTNIFCQCRASALC
jgi:hypothetical protein